MDTVNIIHRLMQSATCDSNAGTEKKQLLDLENRLLEARRQLAVLKKNARALPKMQKEGDCAVCHQNCPREVVLARTSMSSQMDTGSPADLLKKTARAQTRRQQSVRVQVLHTSPCKDGDVGFLEQISANTDGLLLAVDKFLSTGESQHSLVSDGR